MEIQLKETDGLRKNLEAALAGSAKSTNAEGWYTRLDAFLTEVQAAIPSKLKDRAFLARLWDSNPVAAIGNGTVKIGPALESDEFVEWFAQQAALDMPVDAIEAESKLTALYDELNSRLGALCGRTPRLKLNRVLCAIFPDYFTTIADVGALRYLHREMGGLQNDHPVQAHISIRRRVDEVLGPVPASDQMEKVRRMCLPWMLYERLTSDKPSETSIPDDIKQSQLSPLPATLRRKGLTAMKGGFQTLLSFLPALDDGVTRDEFSDLIRQANSDLAPQSIGPFINVVA